MQAQSVLHLAFTKIMQVWLPVPVVGQIFRRSRRQKNMPGVAAIQDPLGDIDSRSCHVRLIVNIGDAINRAAVNPHPHLNMQMILQDPADLEPTSRWLFRTVKKNERHPVSGRHSDEFVACFRRAKAFSASHDSIQLL